MLGCKEIKHQYFLLELEVCVHHTIVPRCPPRGNAHDARCLHAAAPARGGEGGEGRGERGIPLEQHR